MEWQRSFVGFGINVSPPTNLGLCLTAIGGMIHEAIQMLVVRLASRVPQRTKDLYAAVRALSTARVGLNVSEELKM